MAKHPVHNNAPMSIPSRSQLLSTGFKGFVNKHALAYPQKNFTLQLHNAEVRANMSSSTSGFPKTSDAPGEQFEPRQTATSEDYTPDPSKSLQLSPARQRLVDDVGIAYRDTTREANLRIQIIALYSCQPTVERVKRYTPDCVYDDQFVYANDRYKMAGQWFALPKLFKSSINESYQVIRSDDEMIQLKNKQVRNEYMLNISDLVMLTSTVLDLPPHSQNSHHHRPGLAITGSCD
jgi:hypothetical protein